MVAVIAASFLDVCIFKVSLSSTLTDTVCTCKHTDDFVTVGTTSYIPYNMIDFKALQSQDDPFGRSPVVGMMIATVFVYILLVFWAWREDMKDYYKVMLFCCVIRLWE